MLPTILEIKTKKNVKNIFEKKTQNVMRRTERKSREKKKTCRE